MSAELLKGSPDLKRLRDEGFEVAIRQNVVVITNVPYVTSQKEITYATLVCVLVTAGNKAGMPDNHVIHFAGEFPCRSNGEAFTSLGGPGGQTDHGGGIITNFTFSQKPDAGRYPGFENGKYPDYYEKITTYVSIFENEAKVIDPNVSAKTFRIVESDGEDPIFNYPDTNSSRAEINKITNKLRGYKIGIVGVGGTGSYVLDFIAKTPVEEIHLFDKDPFLSHNAFRSPGAPSMDELNELMPKVTYFSNQYSKMRKNIIPHEDIINKDNVSELDAMDFVFICIDKTAIKSEIIAHLERVKIPFIDTGMGLHVVDDSITGIIRTTTSTESMRNHVHKKKLIAIDEDEEAENVYSTNVQIAELNCFNAVMAVIKWKKLCGFYHDHVNEHHTIYSINDNLYNHEDEA